MEDTTQKCIPQPTLDRGRSCPEPGQKNEINSIRKGRVARLERKKHLIQRQQQKQQQELQNYYYHQKQKELNETVRIAHPRRSSDFSHGSVEREEQTKKAVAAAASSADNKGNYNKFMIHHKNKSDTALLTHLPPIHPRSEQGIDDQYVKPKTFFTGTKKHKNDDDDAENDDNNNDKKESSGDNDDSEKSSSLGFITKEESPSLVLTASTLSRHNSQVELNLLTSENSYDSPSQHQHAELVFKTDATTTPPSPSRSLSSLPVSSPLIEQENDRNVVLGKEMATLTQNFAMEHRIFLRAILQLLTERDQYAVGVDVNDPHTIKVGSLKKAQHLMRGGIWKVKYVEIRRGLFSYYEDEMSDMTTGKLQRKSIPLRANSCTCRAVKVQKGVVSQSTGNKGYVFELIVESDVKWKRLWMTSSKEDRQSWIHAIHEAMIGGSVTRGDNFLDYQIEPKKRTIMKKHDGGGDSIVPPNSPYKQNLEEYLRVQKGVKNATSKEEYVGMLSLLCGVPLNVPVQWIKEHVETLSSSQNASKAFEEDSVSNGISQLWKDMLRDSVSINGDLFAGDSGHGPEQIIGELTRCIMKFDRISLRNVDSNVMKKFRITESMALSYARDVLLSCNRTRSGGDSYYCVDTLCSNPDLVVLCPSSTVAEPLTVTVKHATVETEESRSSVLQKYSELSGWLVTRTKKQKHWRKRFGVLSEGVLSFYRHDQPRPHGLQGQLILAGATIQQSSQSKTNEGDANKTSINETRGALEYILCIATSDSKSKMEQFISFPDVSIFAVWNKALTFAISPARKTNAQTLCPVDMNNDNNEQKQTEQNHGNKQHGGDRVGRDDNTAQDEHFRKQMLKEHSERMKIKSGRARSTVEILVRASAMYKICTTDPQGDEEEDTWVMLQTSFLQKFRLSGGPNGRIMRGEEVVQLKFLQGLVSDDAFDTVFG
mmetsp:Transcript_48133/g.72779  ORF Transcript_48133/g.72779 Transcript_48133/m.72779 type:complete len:938 (-) Transcript_48133:79-2892(-)